MILGTGQARDRSAVSAIRGQRRLDLARDGDLGHMGLVAVDDGVAEVDGHVEEAKGGLRCGTFCLEQPNDVEPRPE
jgi:hypothetical protein